MAIMLKKNKADVLRQALSKVQKNTGVSALGAGSIARAFVEGITTEIGDLYDVLDFTVAQSVIGTASGRSLDLIGQLYNVQRRTVGDLVQTDRKIGSFYFYLDSPFSQDIVIPKGTKIFTSLESFVSLQLSYTTADDAVIPQGRMKAYVSIVPISNNAVYTAGANTLIQHDFVSPLGTTVKCINPKPIIGQLAYEDDDNYRLRIIKNVRVASSGTLEAIRFSALGVNGVRDIRVFDSTAGLGTFEVVVIPETKDVSTQVGVGVKQAIDRVRPIGTNYTIKQPDYIPFDVSAAVYLPTLDTTTTELIRRRATVAILRYLNTLLPGDMLVYNKLLQYIFDASEQIKDVEVTSYAPNSVQTVRKNFTPGKSEMIIPGNIQITSA